MKFSTIILLCTIFFCFTYCQNKTIKIEFESTDKDSTTKLNEAKVYILKKVATNSDFNYLKLNDIDNNIENIRNTENLMPIFEPINGQYKYFQFLSTFVGEAYNSEGPPLFKDFHDILIIKTNRENIIIDSYHYTLEWAEPPLQYDLFRSSAKNIILKDNMNISELLFIRDNSWWRNDNEKMDENGIIKLK